MIILENLNLSNLCRINFCEMSHYEVCISLVKKCMTTVSDFTRQGIDSSYS